MTSPVVSVVIPTYNRLDRLHRVLVALAKQTVPASQLDVVVVSDGSTDGTDAYLRSDAVPLPVTFASQDNAGPAAARNLGVTLAQAALVLFVDDDVVPLPPMVGAHLAAHARHGPDTVVLGPMLTPPDQALQPWVRYEQAMLYKQYAAMTNGDWEPTARQFYTGNASVSRHLLLDAGGFDPAFRRAEDVELAYRLAARGLRFVFAPEAGGLHYAERTYRSWRDTAYAYGRNDVVFARDGGQEWLLPTIRREFRDRRPLVRRLTQSCLDHPLRTAVVTKGCKAVTWLGDRARVETLCRGALSIVFNITYYQGVSDEFDAPTGLFDPSMPMPALEG